MDNNACLWRKWPSVSKTDPTWSDIHAHALIQLFINFAGCCMRGPPGTNTYYIIYVYLYRKIHTYTHNNYTHMRKNTHKYTIYTHTQAYVVIADSLNSKPSLLIRFNTPALLLYHSLYIVRIFCYYYVLAINIENVDTCNTHLLI